MLLRTKFGLCREPTQEAERHNQLSYSVALNAVHKIQRLAVQILLLLQNVFRLQTIYDTDRRPLRMACEEIHVAPSKCVNKKMNMILCEHKYYITGFFARNFGSIESYFLIDLLLF